MADHSEPARHTPEEVALLARTPAVITPGHTFDSVTEAMWSMNRGMLAASR